MLNSLNTGVSGLQQFQSQIDLIGNNIANVNTTAYKSSRLNFADTFGEAMVSSSEGTTSSEFGSGVTSDGITTSFIGGGYTPTDNHTDLAIDNGNGFFKVRDIVNDKDYVTRTGNFRVDNQGFLVTGQGYRVQGLVGNGGQGVGDLRFVDDPAIRGAFNPNGAEFVTAKVTSDGRIHMLFDNQDSYVGGQLLLQEFTAPQELSKLGGNLYGNMEAAAPTSADGLPPESGSVGQIKQNALERSNVDLTGEFSSLIMAQRAFQVNARMISTSDELLQELVNLTR